MSADNCIAIAKFPDGYRVAHVQAIENVDYYPEGSPERKRVLKDYFGDSKLFAEKDDAILAAHKIEEEVMVSEFPVLEYGVSYIGEYEDFSEEKEG